MNSLFLSASIVTSIADGLTSVVQYIVDAILWVLNTLCNLVVSAVSSFFSSVLGFIQLPDAVQVVIDSEVWSAVNYFFPLNELFLCLGVVFEFWLGVLLLKVILKSIPTIY